MSLDDDDVQRGRWNPDFGISFPNDGDAEGWVFGVPAAFRLALDIQIVERPDPVTRRKTRMWARREPPRIAFAVGDVFYQPGAARFMKWSEALAILNRAVQVEDVLPEGKLAIEIRDFRAGVEIHPRSRIVVTQREFETYLRSGEEPVL